MKRKKDPRIQEIEHLVSILGPMVEEFEVRYDRESGRITVAFFMLTVSMVKSAEPAEVRSFELEPDQALWFFRGMADGSFWTYNMTEMARAR